MNAKAIGAALGGLGAIAISSVAIIATRKPHLIAVPIAQAEAAAVTLTGNLFKLWRK